MGRTLAVKCPPSSVTGCKERRVPPRKRSPALEPNAQINIRIEGLSAHTRNSTSGRPLRDRLGRAQLRTRRRGLRPAPLRRAAVLSFSRRGADTWNPDIRHETRAQDRASRRGQTRCLGARIRASWRTTPSKTGSMVSPWNHFSCAGQRVAARGGQQRCARCHLADALWHMSYISTISPQAIACGASEWVAAFQRRGTFAMPPRVPVLCQGQGLGRARLVTARCMSSTSHPSQKGHWG